MRSFVVVVMHHMMRRISRRAFSPICWSATRPWLIHRGGRFPKIRRKLELTLAFFPKIEAAFTQESFRKLSQSAGVLMRL
ncbi:MAG: hypothetical protein ACKVY0_12555 [Prosthecobacter sp.]|uniref:hypothetical protein n=1 Tax=Prosthecobacter sp. TaxID=1965333 RepID=UPI0038FDBABE